MEYRQPEPAHFAYRLQQVADESKSPILGEPQGCKRDVEVRDETETFGFQFETETETLPLFTRSRPRRSIWSPRRDRDDDRPRLRHFSRPWHVELYI